MSAASRNSGARATLERLHGLLTDSFVRRLEDDDRDNIDPAGVHHG